MTSPTLFLFANNAETTLGTSLSSAATTVNLTAGSGALFPSPTAGQQFALTLNDAATGNVYEICYCTARSGDTLTVVRGREGTAAVSWFAGDLAANFVTRDTLYAFAQPSTLQAQPGNYAVDTGAANAYVVALNPVITSYPAGLSFVVLFEKASTGASTLNAGGGAVALVRSDGNPVQANDILAGLLGRVTYVPTSNAFFLNGSSASQNNSGVSDAKLLYYGCF